MNDSVKQLPFRGVATALITPFRDGIPDFETFGRLIDRQIEAGIHALVICGTTGEAATLTEAERSDLLRFAVSRIDHRVPVIAGTGSNDTARALRYSREAAAMGADALLVVTPYYNKGTRRGVLTHFRTVAEATDLPLILYNVPGRTGMELSTEDALALAEHPNIVGIKEASGHVGKMADLLCGAPKGFGLWSGNDSDTLPALALGGDGVISVLSNLLPAAMVALCESYFCGDGEQARQIYYRLLPLMHAMFRETNPAPLKYAMSLWGLCLPDLRLPLTEAEEATKLLLCRALQDADAAALS